MLYIFKQVKIVYAPACSRNDEDGLGMEETLIIKISLPHSELQQLKSI